MKNGQKRILATLLALALLLSMGLPVQQANAAAAYDEAKNNLDAMSPVAAEVAKEDIVFSTQAEVVYVGEIDGEDYMFIFMNDYKMLVYNLDTKELVDSVSGTDLFMQPRGAVMDKNGVLWACGLGNRLFWYNVRTGESGAVTFTYNKTDNFAGISNLNLHSLALGDDGNVYFGTSTRGYFGMCDTTTKKVSCISPWLDGDPDDTRGAGDGDPDSHYAGYGGLIVRGGYIYACVEGDQNGDGLTTHFFIKYDIKNTKIVASVDVTDYINENAGQYRQVSAFGENYVMLGCNGSLRETVLIDISKMEKVSLPGMKYGCYGFVAEADGYAYVTGRENSKVGMYKIDIANFTATALPTNPFYAGMNAMLCRGSGWATIDGEKVIVTYRNNLENNTVEPVYYDVILEDDDSYSLNIHHEFTVDAEGVKQGAGNQLRNLIADANREYLYMGCYGVNKVAQYHVSSGAVKIYNTYDEQTDSLLLYDGYLYAGNYSKCAITQVDLETGDATPFFNLKESIFTQYRAHTLAAGENKVFLGTVPKTGVKGGVLAWYDLGEKRTYVAAGDGAENVYYADDTTAVDNAKYYEWHRLSSDEVVTNVTVGGLITNQTINCMVYKNGFIYGTTTVHGGSGSTPDEGVNAKLFVYDVNNTKIVAAMDLQSELDLKNRVEWIDVIAEDPLEPGKFWGVVANVLFSFTFDGENFHIKKEWVCNERNASSEAYVGSGNVWDHRTIVFDGSYMYVAFPKDGIYMIDRSAASQNHWQLSAAVPKQMEMGADGNLYFFNVTAVLSSDLQVLKVAEYTQPLVAASVQDVIDELPEAITNANRADFEAAEALYESLTPVAKALVTNSGKLSAAKIYQVGTTAYGNIDEALAAAADHESQTVKLLKDATVDTVVLLPDVTLDLSGKILTVAGNFSSAIGNVTDSSEGNVGMLKVNPEHKSFSRENTDAPLYDKENGGYRFFTYKLDVYESTDNVGTGREKFWFKFHFYTDDTYKTLDQGAYALVKAGGSGMQISANLTWQETGKAQQKLNPVVFSDDGGTDAFSQRWATGAHPNRWLYVIVSGLDKVSDGTLTVTPVIDLNGVEATNGTVEFIKTTETGPDYGWDPVGPSQYQ